MNKRMKKFFFFLLILFIIFLIVTLTINLYMINTTKEQINNTNKINEKENYDAILVLGCKVNGSDPSLMLIKRLERVVDIYSKNHIKILLSGDHGKNNYDEVNVMRDYIIDFGISDKDIYLDHAGFSTYDSIYRAKYIFGVKKIIIITQEYHLYRALYLANKLGIDAIGIKADDIPQKGVMLKNEMREILSRDKAFIYGIFKPESKYLGKTISLNSDASLTHG